MDRTFFLAGSIAGVLAVLLGAFATHALRDQLDPDTLQVFETGTRYQMYHALALLGAGLALTRWPSNWIEIAGWLFVAGIIIFSGSLYALSLTGVRWMGAITPFGGLALIAGWICLLVGVWRG